MLEKTAINDICNILYLSNVNQLPFMKVSISNTQFRNDFQVKLFNQIYNFNIVPISLVLKMSDFQLHNFR